MWHVSGFNSAKYQSLLPVPSGNFKCMYVYFVQDWMAELVTC